MSTDHNSTRVRFRDLKPYEVVDSLQDLCGPASGTIRLPRWVRWQNDADIDVSIPGRLHMAYQALLSEGTAEVQTELMNKTLLIEAWPELNLDHRVIDLWEARFAVLRNARA